MARRLTSDHAPVSHLHLSKDAGELAYASRRDGVAEVHVVPTAGGEARRVTYLSDGLTYPIGWTEEGRLLYVSAAGEPFASRTWAYSANPDGSDARRLELGPMTAYARGPEGATVLGVNQSAHRGAAWKRYRGGTAAALWMDAEGTGTFVPFLRELDGQLEDPMFVGGRVAFLSDHEGYGNLYSVLPDGSDLRRHSDHAAFYARNAGSDGTAVVYQCAGELFVVGELSPSSTPERVEVSLGAPRSGRARRVLRPSELLGEYSVDRSGRASAVEARGEIHWLTHRLGPARVLGGGGGSRARLPRVGGEASAPTVVFVTDATGEDAIEVAAPLGEHRAAPARLGAGSMGRVLDLAISPDAAHAAVATHDGRVILVALESGEERTVSSSAHGDASGLVFSPDSRYLAWSEAGPEPLRHIRMAEVESGACFDVTPLRFRDEEPVFSPDAKSLAFLSSRIFDPLYDTQVFDMSFAFGMRPYLVTLDAATPSPFDPEVAGRPRPGADGPAHEGAREPGDHEGEHEPTDHEPTAHEPAGAEPTGAEQEAAMPTLAAKEAKEGEPPATVVEREGLAARVVPFPVAAGRYSGLRAAQGGFLWLTEPAEGVLGEGRARLGARPERARLIRFEMASMHETELVAAVEAFEVSGDGKTVVVREGGSLRVLPSERKVTPGADPAGETETTEVDLGRLRVEIDPAREWAQMYEEAARLMRDHFWIEDMGGVDWGEVVARYRPMLEKVATRDDVSDLLWEVQGELGSSHAYEMPPPLEVEEERKLGLLGADLVRGDDGAWRVAEVLAGESSLLSGRSPLRAPGVGVGEGDAIVAVDGRTPDPIFGPAARLVGAAGKPVQLSVKTRGGEAREVVVEPLADDRQLRYQQWVKGRREHVHTATGGRVGYMHIPDMMGRGWAELHRDLRVEVACEGLVVDVRYNAGGHVSPLVLETIGRTVRGWETVRHMGSATYPPHAPRGPRVLVANEQAGSDGDIVTAGFRQRGLGKIVGKRTWGGVIGIDGRYHLVDGTVVTQPRYAFWFYGLGWDVENYGVDPDEEVEMTPQDWASARDPQLDRAIELVMEALEEAPAAVPPDPVTRPTRRPPHLPPRP